MKSSTFYPAKASNSPIWEESLGASDLEILKLENVIILIMDTDFLMSTIFTSGNPPMTDQRNTLLVHTSSQKISQIS